VNYGGPIFAFSLGYPPSSTGDQFGVDAIVNGSITRPYTAPSNISRGVWHTVDIIMKPLNPGGFCHVWMNGVQIANINSGFYANSGYWWKVGLYRGGITDQIQVGRYRNLLLRLT